MERKARMKDREVIDESSSSIAEQFDTAASLGAAFEAGVEFGREADKPDMVAIDRIEEAQVLASGVAEIVRAICSQSVVLSPEVCFGISMMLGRVDEALDEALRRIGPVR